MARMLVVLMLVVVEVATATTPVPAPAPAVDCTQVVMTLMDCLSFVQEGGKILTKPEGTCCSSLKKVVEKNKEADCLCEEFRNSASLGISINITKALSLPDACGMETPSSVTNCDVGSTLSTDAPGSAPSPFFSNAPGSSPITPTSGKSAAPKLPFPVLLPLMPSILLVSVAVGALHFF